MQELVNFYSNNKKIFEWSLHLIREKKYKHKEITKKNGNKRKLSIPPSPAKVIQKNFLIFYIKSILPQSQFMVL